MGRFSELDILINHDRVLDDQRADGVIDVLMVGLKGIMALGEDDPAYRHDARDEVREGVREVLMVRFPDLLLQAAELTTDKGRADHDQLIQAALDGDTSPRLALVKILTTLDLIPVGGSA